MNIDERLQALTMNLELMSHDRENDRAKSAAEHIENMEWHRQFALRQEKSSKQIDDLTALIRIDAENIRSLARIAEAHENRLDRLT